MSSNEKVKKELDDYQKGYIHGLNKFPMKSPANYSPEFMRGLNEGEEIRLKRDRIVKERSWKEEPTQSPANEHTKQEFSHQDYELGYSWGKLRTPLKFPANYSNAFITGYNEGLSAAVTEGLGQTTSPAMQSFEQAELYNKGYLAAINYEQITEEALNSKPEQFKLGYKEGWKNAKANSNKTEPNYTEDKIYPSLFSEAERLITNDRRKEYGSAKESFERVAKVWSVLLKVEISAKQVAECMIAFKLLRENHQHKRDNLVDLMGYTGLIEQILKA